MSGTVQASDGTQLPLDDIPFQLAFDGNFLSTITVQYPRNSDGAEYNYVQTFTNNGTQVTGGSRFVPTTPV